ncbi:hypothetical protein [Amycolatopsis minnesotensis]|uniref:Uncharacterized protein n=1 Tax=Amycolatopsis minnesotensis TaxID=337894 RepID=A0ABN2RI40_9PSEU
MTHPQQPGNWGGYPGQPQGYPQGPGYPGHGYPRGGPPKKSRTGLWAGLAAGVVVLVVLAITGFVAPGFFLGKDSGTGQAGPETPPPAPPSESTSDTPTTAPSRPSSGASAESLEKAVALTRQFVDKLNANDTKGAGAMKCPDSGTILEGLIVLSIEPPTSLTVGSATSGARRIQVQVSGTTMGKQTSGTVTVQDSPGAPQCIRMLTIR